MMCDIHGKLFGFLRWQIVLDLVVELHEGCWVGVVKDAPRFLGGSYTGSHGHKTKAVSR